ncbi:MAG: hypothetical protein ACK4TK_05830 [Thiobacillaceae bacterium]
MMHRLGIRARVLLLAMLPIAVIAVSLTWYFIASRLQDMDRALEEQGQAMARQLAQACEYALFIGERELLEDLANGLRKDATVMTVRITDRDGRVWVHLGPREGMSEAASRSAGGLHWARDALFVTEPVLSRPIVLASHELGGEARAQTLGQVTVGISLQTTRARQREILVNSFLLSAVVLIMVILMAIRLGRDIVRPIGHLTEVV